MKALGVIGAMDEEITLLTHAMEQEEVQVKAGIRFIRGRLHGQELVVCRSGVGKVNAAATTQLLIDVFGCEAVWFTGVAGALAPELKVGDVVVSIDCMQHDMDAQALGFPRGVIPFQEQSVFVAEPAFVRLAMEAGRETLGDRINTGRILSGDQFIADRSVVASLRNELQGDCTEMEGAAVAQVCAMNGVPFVIIRSMSDQADGAAPVSFSEFTVLASNTSFQLVKAMLSRLRSSFEF